MAKKIYNLRDSKTDKIKSSNIVYNNKTLDTVLFPIKSIIITSTNENPSSTYGGTWELIDKTYKQIHNRDDSLVTGINATINDMYFTRSGHNVRFRLSFKTNVSLGDSTVELVKVDLQKLGIDNFYMQIVQDIMTSDGGNSLILYSLHYETGIVTSVDVFSKDGTGTCPAGANIYINIVIPIEPIYMLDEFCDKFYWKRTA